MSVQQIKSLRQLSPRAQEASIGYINKMANSLVLRIQRGEVEIPEETTPMDAKAQVKENATVRDAVREKLHLERRLAYLDKSIRDTNSSSAMGKLETEKSPAQVIELHQQKLKEFREKDRQQRLDIQKIKSETEKRLKKAQCRQLQSGCRRREKELDIKRQGLGHSIANIKQRTSKRQTDGEEMNNRVKSLMKVDTIHKRMMREQELQESKQLDERMKKLEELRKQYKPLNYEDIDKHDEKFMETRKERDEGRAREREEFMNRKYKIPYESIFYKKIKGQTNQVDESMDALTKRDRIKQFTQLLKQKYKPQVSPKLTKELSMRVERESAAFDDLRRRQSPQEGRKKGIEYLQYMRSLPKVPAREMKLQTMEPSHHKYQNYLVHSARGTVDSWKEILGKSTDNPQEKVEQLLLQSEKMQEKLRQREQRARMLKDGQTSDIDDRYIEMVNAKLQFYQMNQQ